MEQEAKSKIAEPTTTTHGSLNGVTRIIYVGALASEHPFPNAANLDKDSAGSEGFHYQSWPCSETKPKKINMKEETETRLPKAGDIVRLKSGGPEMTVMYAFGGEGCCTCVWFSSNGGYLHDSVFIEETLDIKGVHHQS